MSWIGLGAVVVGALVLTAPSNWFVRTVLHRARGRVDMAEMGSGRWIGIMERLIIYVLVLTGEAAAAGLVAAVKTILRFPEINAEPARIEPEYVLVGSLASWLAGFAVAVLVAQVV